MSRQRRCFTDAVKKQIAARQRWQCGLCFDLLSAAFEIDHTIPLWNGGEDSPDNASALCANCHAAKTQNEAIERNKITIEKRRRRREIFEKHIFEDEESKRTYKQNKDGRITCDDCKQTYWPIFPHSCRNVRKRVAARLGVKVGASTLNPRRGLCPLNPRINLGVKSVSKSKKTELFSEFFFTNIP